MFRLGPGSRGEIIVSGYARRIQRFTPLAGMARAATDRMMAQFDGRAGMPIGPWEGLGVAFAWALGALAAGYVLLRVRDA